MSDLPEGWAWSTVADVLANGFFADGDWVETKDQDPDGEIRLLQLADVGDGFFRDRSSRFVNVEAAERLTVKPVEPGDVLVARMPAPLGRACIAPDLGQPAITVVDVCILRPDAGIDRRWLMWALNSPVTRAEVAGLATGTTRKRISRRNLATIRLPVPPLPEQRRIVAAIEEHFSRLDAAEASLAAADRRTAVLAATEVDLAFANLTDRAPLVTWPRSEVAFRNSPSGSQRRIRALSFELRTSSETNLSSAMCTRSSFSMAKSTGSVCRRATCWWWKATAALIRSDGAQSGLGRLRIVSTKTTSFESDPVRSSIPVS
ncbi:MAG: restriction endonuclease subunit S [Candidatus Microthrix sp.]|nr:restriction endonuclease subunit S [Candidatus Microthrix sp.]